MTLVEKYRDRVIPVVIKEKISATDLILNVLSQVYYSVVSLATFVASFGVDIWNPTNVGSHSTDEKSRDQWVKGR